MNSLFLLCGLFFPRLTLLFAHLTDTMPPNPTDLPTDVVAGILVPRLLIAYWTVANDESILWTILYVVFWFLFLGIGGQTAASRGRRS